MENTSCYSYFAICSNGVIKDGIGFVANPNSDFDPEYITNKLKIEPHETIKMGTVRKRGNAEYSFSSWTACFQTEPALDVEAQCLNIAKALKGKISLLLELKQEFDVNFTINIVPHIYNEETPALSFNKEFIEFCYLTGTELEIDLYVFGKE